LVEIDYSSEENWVAATRSGCPAMLHEVGSGDIHMATAISVKLAPVGATADSHPAERNQAKPLTHGTNYGISPVGIAKRLGIPVLQARRLLRAYDEAHPVFRQWQQSLVHHAYSTRRITAPMGWSMHVNSKVSRRTLMNWMMQSCGSEILWCAVTMLVRHGFTICATAHDSIYFLMPLDGLAERVALAREIMTSVTLPFTYGHPIPTKTKIVLPGERLLDAETRPVWDRLIGLARGQKTIKEALHEAA
jgi:DNA polymerase I-like protein with 3'-5' exonuclease and polymerase domains